MNILCTVIADMLHVIGILLVCKYYLRLEEKTEDKYRYVKVILISITTSLIIYAMESQTIALIIYFACVEGIIIICYSAKLGINMFSTIWVVIIVEVIDMISISVIDTIGKIVMGHNATCDNIIAMLLSVSIIYFISIILRKMNINGIKNVSTGYMLMVYTK